MRSVYTLSLAAALTLAACGGSSGPGTPVPTGTLSTAKPSPDPRIGLRAGRMDAAEATWNLRVVSKTPPSAKFVGSTNSDLAFSGNYVIQGNYNGWQIWDISNPSSVQLATAYYCPASQSDVSTYKNLLFISGEGLTGRLDCGGQGVRETVSKDRIRGLRIFDITDIRNPKNVGNVQTCRGSHTHTVVVDPKDKENVYVYISGSSSVRPSEELEGCIADENDPNSALFRIEAIKIPLNNPGAAAIVSHPRIFNDLTAPKRHGETAADVAAASKRAAEARARGEFTAQVMGTEMVLPSGFTRPMLDSIVGARGGTGAPTAADSAALRAALPGMIAKMIGSDSKRGPTQCHDITVYPAISRAGGACEGYGFLIDITNPVAPVRMDVVADSNFSYWHSATFNNDGTKILFSDEWGGGGGPKCRASDPKEWGADAIFTIENNKMVFQSYYKLPAAQTDKENCVAHNGSLIPIPGRDVMVQAWYQGGISVFDWTDPRNPTEVAFFDRGPVDSTRMGNGGSWSVYWYNGYLVSSEISRGLDILELAPSGWISQNEIDAAKTVKYDYHNTQGQTKMEWPATFALARAYLDQLERSRGLAADRIAAARSDLAKAEKASGQVRKDALNALATRLHSEANSAGDAPKAHKLATSVGELAK
jgi:hypothetical protein